MWNLQNLLETITRITKPGTWRLGKARIKERLLIYAQPLCLPFKFVLLNAHYSVMWGVRRKKSSFLTSPDQLVTNQSEKTHVVGRWEHLLLVLVTLGARTWAQGSLSHCPEWWAMGLNPHTTRVLCLSLMSAPAGPTQSFSPTDRLMVTFNAAVLHSISELDLNPQVSAGK